MYFEEISGGGGGNGNNDNSDDMGEGNEESAVDMVSAANDDWRHEDQTRSTSPSDDVKRALNGAYTASSSAEKSTPEWVLLRRALDDDDVVELKRAIDGIIL